MFTQFAGDWCHPNDRGHEVWAAQAKEELQPPGRRTGHVG